MPTEQVQINAAEWQDPVNWKPFVTPRLSIYTSRKDSRILVPKRSGAMGFTFNAGHPVGKVLLILFLVIPVAMTAAVILLIMRAQ